MAICCVQILSISLNSQTCLFQISSNHYPYEKNRILRNLKFGVLPILSNYYSHSNNNTNLQNFFSGPVATIIIFIAGQLYDCGFAASLSRLLAFVSNASRIKSELAKLKNKNSYFDWHLSAEALDVDVDVVVNVADAGVGVDEKS